MPEQEPENEQRKISRADFIMVCGLAGAASMFTACAGSAQPGSTPTHSQPTPADLAATPTPELSAPSLRQPVARFAHISDMHIDLNGSSRQYFSRAMRSVLSIDPPVDFVLNTGDCVMDVMFADRESALAQWDVFQSVLGTDFPLPVYHAIGNHDVWGWGLPAEAQARAVEDPLFGKGMMVHRLSMPGRYYAFERGGWRFVVLDSTQLNEQQEATGHPYTGLVDDEQYEWLVQQLETTPTGTPICIISHIPIFGACGLLDSSEATGNWVMPGAWQHIDGRRLIALFWQHRNIQLCLTGHTHQEEDLRYHGVKYLSNGSLSANWWNGPYHDFPPAYAVINLYADGTSECEMRIY